MIIATRGCILAAVLRIRAVVPLVFTTSGGMAPECAAFMKQVALRLADKRKDDYAVVANYIRTKIRFALLVI